MGSAPYLRATQNFTRATEVFGDKCATVAHLPPTALYELAAELREEIERMIAAGDMVTAATVKRVQRRSHAPTKCRGVWPFSYEISGGARRGIDLTPRICG